MSEEKKRLGRPMGSYRKKPNEKKVGASISIRADTRKMMLKYKHVNWSAVAEAAFLVEGKRQAEGVPQPA